MQILKHFFLDGRFSVFVYSEDGFVLSCAGEEDLTITEPITLDIGYAGYDKNLKETYKFYYDCPRGLKK